MLNISKSHTDFKPNLAHVCNGYANNIQSISVNSFTDDIAVSPRNANAATGLQSFSLLHIGNDGSTSGHGVRVFDIF